MFHFISRYTRQLDDAGFDSIDLTVGVDELAVSLVHHTSPDGPKNGTLYLPVGVGSTFSFTPTNNTHANGAFPVRLGDGTNWTNLFSECRVVDPAKMPSTGGMWEMRPGDHMLMDSFQLGGGLGATFRVASSDTLNDGDLSHNLVEIYYRRPEEPNVVIGSDGSAQQGASARSTRSAPSDVTVIHGEVKESGRVVTNLGYVEEAHLVAQINLISRRQMAELLATDGVELDASDARAWMSRAVQLRYPERMTNLVTAV